MSPEPARTALPNPAEIREAMEREGRLDSEGSATDHVVPSEDPAALWGVEHSACGRRWRLKDVSPEETQCLGAGHGLPDMVARILAGRGVTGEEIETILAPTLKALMPDPSVLQDMDRGAGRIAKAVMDGTRIGIFADYDVDGATSAALMLRFLRALGQDPLLHVPDRIAEGYGPNGPALRALGGKGASLIVTLDCGVTSFAALEEAAEAGLEIVVVDHHQADDTLPRAHAVINPNRKDDISGLGNLAAVGVTFMTLVAVTRALRQADWFERAGVEAPNLMQWLDLVALGTVCDVVPLQGLNRAFVVQGLKLMGTWANPGLKALAQVAGMTEAPEAYHLGFVLGPRVNAGGRVGKADEGALLLSSDDLDEAGRLARELDGYNRERRDIELAVLDEARRKAEEAIDAWPARPVLLIAGEGWHPGVIGIVASRLKDEFERVVLVLSIEEGVAKASGRSVKGADLGAAVLAAKEAGLLVAGGGHAMAAGLTIDEACIGDLDRFLCEQLGEAVATARADTDRWVDATVALPGITRELYDALDRAGPFGAGNPEPVIAVKDALVQWVQPVGESHLRVTLATPEGARVTGIAFRCTGTPLGTALREAQNRTVHVLGRLRADNWKGRNGVQLHIEDLAPAEG